MKHLIGSVVAPITITITIFNSDRKKTLVNRYEITMSYVLPVGGMGARGGDGFVYLEAMRGGEEGRRCNGGRERKTVGGTHRKNKQQQAYWPLRGCL